jgi:TRAP-type C4-dicarboxylate transport system permease small subunit
VLATGQKSPTLGLPMGWIYAAPVIGFSLLGLRFALSFFGRIDRFSLSNQH